MMIHDVLFEAEGYTHVSCGKSLVEFIGELQKMLEGVAEKDRPAVKIDISAHEEYGEPTPSMEISCWRDETRGEADKRRRDAKKRNATIEDEERASLARLKAKYEG